MKMSAQFYFVLLFLALFGFSACVMGTEEERKRQHLPDFEFEGLYQESFKKSDLPSGKPVTILFYDPDCKQCKSTLAALAGLLKEFEGTELVLVSPADRTRVIPVLSDHKLLQVPHVNTLLCTPQQFLDTFGTTTLPTMLFYTAKHSLVRAYKGAVNKPGMLEGIELAKDK